MRVSSLGLALAGLPRSPMVSGFFSMRAGIPIYIEQAGLHLPDLPEEP